MVAVRSDGTVETVTFGVQRRGRDIDDAIRRLVQHLAPYPTFPPALAREYDVIEIRRTWHADTFVAAVLSVAPTLRPPVLRPQCRNPGARHVRIRTSHVARCCRCQRPRLACSGSGAGPVALAGRAAHHAGSCRNFGRWQQGVDVVARAGRPGSCRHGWSQAVGETWSGPAARWVSRARWAPRPTASTLVAGPTAPSPLARLINPAAFRFDPLKDLAPVAC